MSQAYDVVVVGGGIVGVSTAYHCVHDRLRTLLVDRADAGRATSAGAGIISPEISPRDDRAWSDYEMIAARYYDILLEQIREIDGAKTGYARCGLLLVAASDDELPSFSERATRIFKRQRETGWPVATDVEEISPDEAREKFPVLTSVLRALYSRNAARMDGRLFTDALRRAAEERGLTTMHASAERILVEHGKVMGVVVDGSTYSTANVVIAGGAWSEALAAQLGIRVPVQPQRGQIVHLLLPWAKTEGWAIVNAFHGHYIVPWPDGRIVVGATRETGSGYDPRLTAAGVHEVLAEALRVAPGLASAGIHELRVGLRPLSPDTRPLLDRLPSVEGAYLATGHGASGLQGGPYSGKVMCDLLQGKPSEISLEPFRLSRFDSVQVGQGGGR